MGARQQAERLAVGVPLLAQLLQAQVRARHGPAARQREALQLPQAQVLRPLLEALLHCVVGQERLAGAQQSLGLVPAPLETVAGVGGRLGRNGGARVGGVTRPTGDHVPGGADVLQHLPGRTHVSPALGVGNGFPRAEPLAFGGEVLSSESQDERAEHVIRVIHHRVAHPGRMIARAAASMCGFIVHDIAQEPTGRVSMVRMIHRLSRCVPQSGDAPDDVE